MSVQCKSNVCVGSAGCSICVLQKALCRTCWIAFHQKCGSKEASQTLSQPQSKETAPSSQPSSQSSPSPSQPSPSSSQTQSDLLHEEKLTKPTQVPMAWDSVLTNPQRQGRFFVEWRVVDPSIAAGIERLQEQVRQLYPQAVIRQSCATDNMHITMSEFTVGSAEDLNRAIAAIQELEKEMAVNPAVKLQVAELGHFDKKVLYAKVQSESSDGGLEQWTAALNRKFKAANLKPNTRPFVAHLTIAKAGASPLPASVLSLKPGVLGTQLLTELHFCVKRLPSEPTPPVVYTLRCAQ